MKRALAFALCLVLLAGALIFAAPLKAEAESLYIKKIVSVVYDDSGSMVGSSNAKWAYASYAMQTFCALLNSEDQLYITYMSEVYNPVNATKKIDLSDDKIQSSVDSIRKHFGSSGTPYEAVEIAKEKLRNVNETDPYTQYWLVVITDGVFASSSATITQQYMNNDFESFVGETMANGTRPQVTYMAIGDDVIAPDENTEKGIFVDTASRAEQITECMKDIADKISGRTRLDASEITQVDSKTIRVQSDIPLLNIAVLAQTTGAKLTKAKYEGGGDLTVKRSVSVKYPESSGMATDKNLYGGAFLVNGGGDTIDSGTYLLEFDSDISVDSLVIMFEPALEIRIVVSCNGVELKDISELNNCRAGDKISVSYKIFEVGTDNEISLDILPKGSSCEITLSEDGKVVERADGKDMTIEEFELDELDTQIKASVIIPGFNPIEFVFDFLPLERAPDYTITAEFASNVRSVHIDNLSTNKDLSVIFKVYADGELLDNPSDVKALNPQISLSPSGNDGTTDIDSEGRIIFTPNSSTTNTTDAFFDVTVTCTIGTVSESITYTVLLAEYVVVPIPPQDSIVKTGFYDNDIGASFYITKDGVRLGKADVGGNFDVSFAEEYEGLKVRTEILDDGTMVCIPYSEEERKLNVWTWLWNWKYYFFDLPNGNLELTLSHRLGTASNTIPIEGETQKYMILCVYAPIALEIFILAVLIYWLLCIWLKPKFPKDAMIYMGDIHYSQAEQCHRITGFAGYSAKNRIGYLLKPSMKAESVVVGTLCVKPETNGDLICDEELPWLNIRSNEIIINTERHPRFPAKPNFRDPSVLQDYVDRCSSLYIEKIELSGRMRIETDNTLSASADKYTLMLGPTGIKTIKGNDVIYTGKIVIYRY